MQGTSHVHLATVLNIVITFTRGVSLHQLLFTVVVSICCLLQDGFWNEIQRGQSGCYSFHLPAADQHAVQYEICLTYLRLGVSQP